MVIVIVVCPPPPSYSHNNYRNELTPHNRLLLWSSTSRFINNINVGCPIVSIVQNNNNNKITSFQTKVHSIQIVILLKYIYIYTSAIYRSTDFKKIINCITVNRNSIKPLLKCIS